ncbi:TetR/AcrR family transcriptional regulator [Corynebacterium lubricantis]|uniref:TetR/AcrR family transcriptional regulator n=1 Tax=Corynebacterium lubricantis TaxID=541095 RepID=UPI0003617323|nr:TetR/AcrR family transcriptional regulator [Corynebacterium lubricantis]
MSVKTETKKPTARQKASRNATDEKIAASTLAIAREHGLSAVTIDSVAAHSGVAKTTIYRRYADRMDMIVGVSNQVTFEFSHDHLVSREGILELYRKIKDYLENQIGIRLIGSLMASSDEDLAKWRNRVVSPLQEEFDRYFQEAVECGVVREDADRNLMSSMAIGGMLLQYTTEGKIPDDYPDKIVDILWPLVKTPDQD